MVLDPTPKVTRSDLSTEVVADAGLDESRLVGAGQRVIRHAEDLSGRVTKLSAELARLRLSTPYILAQEVATTKGTGYLTLLWRMHKALQAQRARRLQPRQEKCLRYSNVRGSGFLIGPATTWISAEAKPGTHYVFECFLTCFDEVSEKGVVMVVQVENQAGELLSFETDFLKHRRDASAFTYVSIGPAVDLRIPISTPANAVRVQFGFSQHRSTNSTHIYVGSWFTQLPDDTRTRPSGVVKTPDTEHETDSKSPQIISILDEFSTECLRPEFDLVSVSKLAWRTELEEKTPVAMLAESAWRGNNGSWRYALSNPERWGTELGELLMHCEEHCIPTLFWNKEDPAHFETFSAVAQSFDHIFTTDAACVDRYHRLTGKSNAHVLPFAAQPRLHNPIRTGPLIQKFAFTGSWRGVKYPSRAKWLDILLEPLIERGALDIFDRFAGETKDPDLIFPEHLAPAVRGGMEYRDLISKVYKRYAAFMNVNSVESSQTMLARRVYELLACGAPVVSSPSPAIERTFGDIVPTVETKAQVRDVAERLLTDWHYRESLSTRGVRLVHSNHTFRHRINFIGEIAGFSTIERAAERVSVICVSKRKNYLDHLAEQLERQTHTIFEIIYVAHTHEDWSMEVRRRLGGIANLKVLQLGTESVLADGLNAALSVSEGDYCAKFDDDDYYGANYLADAVLAFGYAPEAGVVGKQSFFAYLESENRTVLRFKGNSYKHTKRVHGGTLVWDRRKTKGIGFERVTAGTDSLFLKACASRGIPVVSIDAFNYVHVRHRNLGDHTWQIDDQEFLRSTIPLGDGLALNKVFV